MSSVDFLADLGPSADVHAVARVLSAASAPAWPHELRGYESARRAFENAGSANTSTTPIRHSAGYPLRRLLGVKLAAVAGALTVTGVAVAAEADVLPSPIQRAAHQVLGGVGVPEPDQTSRSGQTLASSPGSSGSLGSSGSSSGQQGFPNVPSTDRGTSDRSTDGGLLPGTPTGTADTPGQSPSTAVDVVALCRAYAAHPGDSNGNGNGNGNDGLNAHDRKVLAALAGGKEKIAAYCAQVLGGSTTGGPVPQPTGLTTAPTTSTTPSVTPDPSHDHKPDPSSSSSATFGPNVTTSSSGGGTGHPHAPDVKHSGH